MTLQVMRMTKEDQVVLTFSPLSYFLILSSLWASISGQEHPPMTYNEGPYWNIYRDYRMLVHKGTEEMIYTLYDL